jgi:TetR/AcrR family transcriptional repressor of nem operon
MSKGEETRARVLEAARQLINRKGFRSTSVNDIIKVTGVKKGNLYFHFASKEELGLAILRQAHEDFMAFLCNNLKGDRPLEKVSSLLDAVFEKQRRTKFVGGCLFGNTALELSDANDRITQLIREVFRGWTELLAGVLREAQDAGDLKVQVQPKVLAKHIVASIEGGIMMSRLSKNGDHLRDCLSSIRVLLGIEPK